MSEKMVVMLLHLGTNMWAKPGNTCLYRNREEGGYSTVLRTDRAVWREVTDYLPTVGVNTLLIDMGEAVELKRRPELAIEGTWSQKEFKAELQRLRSIGLTPLPKFNFSCAHNAWMKEIGDQVDTPEYYALCRDVIEETIELFDHPAFFHLGLDDETAKTQEYQPFCITRSPERLAYDANFLFDLCRAGGARPWIWADSNTVKQWGGEKGFCAGVPRDVAVSNRYNEMTIRVGEPDIFSVPEVALYRDLEKWGYDQIPTGSTVGHYKNLPLTANFIRKYLDPAHVLGIMSAPWLFTVPLLKRGIRYDARVLGDALARFPLEKGGTEE